MAMKGVDVVELVIDLVDVDLVDADLVDLYKKYVFANFGTPKCSKFGLQIEVGGVFYAKPHQKITPDSLVPSE